MTHLAVDRTPEESSPSRPLHAQIFKHLGIAEKGTSETSWTKRCQKQKLDPSTVTRMLAAFDEVVRTVPPVSIELMTLTELCDHIEQTHHCRLHETLSQLDELIHATADDEEAPENDTNQIHEAFLSFRNRTTAHLQMESRVLFPLIRQMEAESPRASVTHRALRTTMVEMENDHNEADEALAELHTLAQMIAPSLSQAIGRLEIDLHEQIYKENHALFPKALALADRG